MWRPVSECARCGFTALGLVSNIVHVANLDKIEYNFAFGSEMPWDSTGQEEVYGWSRYFHYDYKAEETLNAILAYDPTIPSWGYNGSARRYWDFIYGADPKYSGIERQLHHYGSGINAIPGVGRQTMRGQSNALVSLPISSLRSPFTAFRPTVLQPWIAPAAIRRAAARWFVSGSGGSQCACARGTSAGSSRPASQ